MGVDVNVIDLLIGSALMPPIIAVVNQPRFPSAVKGLVALLACLLAALVTEWVRGPIDLAGWRNTAVVVTGAALVLYRVWWQPSGIAPAIELVTSGRAATVDTPATTTAVPGRRARKS